MADRISSNSGPQALAAKQEAAATRRPLDLKRQTIAKSPVVRTRSQVESAQKTIAQTQTTAKNPAPHARPQVESAQKAIAQAQTQEIKGQTREKALARLDVLVEGMGALAEKISSKKVSSSQRSVLMSRFNDLQRQVNRIDGVVGGEGLG